MHRRKTSAPSSTVKLYSENFIERMLKWYHKGCGAELHKGLQETCRNTQYEDHLTGLVRFFCSKYSEIHFTSFNFIHEISYYPKTQNRRLTQDLKHYQIKDSTQFLPFSMSVLVTNTSITSFFSGVLISFSNLCWRAQCTIQQNQLQLRVIPSIPESSHILHKCTQQENHEKGYGACLGVSVNHSSSRTFLLLLYRK